MSQITNIFGMLALDEGVKTIIYPDTLGYWTIGIGHLLSKVSKSDATNKLDSSLGRSTKGVISKEEAEKLFQIDVASVIKEVKLNSTLAPIYDSLDDVRKLGLLNMVFQMGAIGAAGFKNSLTLIKNKNYGEAGVNLRKSAWYKQTPKRAERVIKVLTSGTLNSYN